MAWPRRSRWPSRRWGSPPEPERIRDGSGRRIVTCMVEEPPAYAIEPAPVVDPAAGPPRRGRRRLVAGIAVAVLAIGGLAAVLVTTGRLGQPAKPAARVALVDPDGALEIVDGQGGNRVVHAPAGTAFRFPAWSPDGTRVAAVANTATGRGHPGVLDRDGRLGVARWHRGLPERRVGALLPVLDAGRSRDHVPHAGGRQPGAALRAGGRQRRQPRCCARATRCTGPGRTGTGCSSTRAPTRRPSSVGSRPTAARSPPSPACRACSGRRRHPPTASTRRTS